MNLLQACSSTEQLELNARLYNCGHLAFPVAAEMITGADMMKLLVTQHRACLLLQIIDRE